MEQILEIINVVGIISFAAAGAMVAIDKENDWFGVVLMSLMTCFGGGILRDVMAGQAIGRIIPAFFTDLQMEIIVCICTATAVFFIAMILKEKYVKEETAVERINNVLDALGIGVFTVAGTSSYLPLGPFVAITMGLISSVGGSVIRDVILGSIPMILKKRVYAIPCIGGSAIYYVIVKHVLPGSTSADIVATVSCIVFIFIIRMCATYFKWDIPKAIDFTEIRARQGNEKDKETNE